jgi:hypothetical protein
MALDGAREEKQLQQYHLGGISAKALSFCKNLTSTTNNPTQVLHDPPKHINPLNHSGYYIMA